MKEVAISAEIADGQNVIKTKIYGVVVMTTPYLKGKEPKQVKKNYYNGNYNHKYYYQ